ncbi:MAG TPA: acyl-CoA desaturase [Micromonosporaceae bacterium]|nr:acyl-CoA desaturase [Micromonosporaceae bacterium]
MAMDTGTLVRSSTGTFEELAAKVRSAGLLDPRPGYYALKIAFNLAVLAGTWTAVVLVGDSWWQLALAVVLAGGYVQTGFIAHDTGHKQITRTRTGGALLGLLHMNLLLGIAYGWWVSHHNRHHSNPNNLDLDPDTVRRPVIFAPDELPVKGRTRGRRFIIRFQSVMFFVLLAHEAYRVRSAGVKAFRAGALKTPALELALVAVHLAAYLVVVFTVMAPAQAVAFVLVHQLLFGLYLGAVFAPNHKGMVVYRSDVDLDWLHRQVLTSRNVYSSRFTDMVFGGLNYQIEHHLFPTMPRVNLRRARPIVKAYCEQHGIPYLEVPVLASYRAVSRFFGRVSRRALAGTAA